MAANVPSINSLDSLYLDLERSSMLGQLRAVQQRLGNDKFPLVPITYFDYPEHMVLFDHFPAVCKVLIPSSSWCSPSSQVSHAHAGMGKSKLVDMTAFRDISTVLSLHQDYCTVEPFLGPIFPHPPLSPLPHFSPHLLLLFHIYVFFLLSSYQLLPLVLIIIVSSSLSSLPPECDYGIRIQKIGNHYRVYKKVFTGSGWKSQFGGADLQYMELTDQFKLWADECAKCYGGMV